MGIDVKGNGNRVAGRDYYENQFKPCQQCETRFIETKRRICKHCENLERQEKYKFVGMAMLAAFFFILVNLHEWRVERGSAVGLEGLIHSALGAAAIVFGGIFFYAFLKEWFARRR